MPVPDDARLSELLAEVDRASLAVSDDDRPPSDDAAIAVAVITATADVARLPSADEPDAVLVCVAAVESVRLSELAAAAMADWVALVDVSSAPKVEAIAALLLLPVLADNSCKSSKYTATPYMRRISQLKIRPVPAT